MYGEPNDNDAVLKVVVALVLALSVSTALIKTAELKKARAQVKVCEEFLQNFR